MAEGRVIVVMLTLTEDGTKERVPMHFDRARVVAVLHRLHAGVDVLPGSKVVLEHGVTLYARESVEEVLSLLAWER